MIYLDTTNGLTVSDGVRTLHGEGKQSAEAFGLVSDILGGRQAQEQEFVVLAGPGSFTGIRLGLAIAKGLRIAGCRVMALNNFDAMRLCGHSVLEIPAGALEKYACKDGKYSLENGTCAAVELDPLQILSGLDFVENELEPLYIKPHYAERKK